MTRQEGLETLEDGLFLRTRSFYDVALHKHIRDIYYSKQEVCMTRQEGLKEIEEAKWTKDEYDYFLLTVHDINGDPVQAWLSVRPNYCDRGHIQFNIDGYLKIDSADSFPRFFFSSKEADHHVRCFLKWRLWNERTYEHTLDDLITK
jgi:hypothetical protein